MKKNYLKTFEELVLLTVVIQAGNAYGVSIKQALAKEDNNSTINISVVHATLRLLEGKRFIQSGWSDATINRRGHRKRIFRISSAGRKALKEGRDTKVKLWTQIPDYFPKMIQL